MKRIIRLSESDLTRIVKKVLQEDEYPRLIDPSQFEFINNHDDKPFDDLLKKYNFEYQKKEDDMYIYFLKQSGCDFIVSTKNLYGIGRAAFFIYIITKGSGVVNYIERVTGEPGLKTSTMNTKDIAKVNSFIKNALESCS